MLLRARPRHAARCHCFPQQTSFWARICWLSGRGLLALSNIPTTSSSLWRIARIKPIQVDLVRRFRRRNSARNIDKWHQFCPAAGLARIAPAQTQDIDVFFYGVLNDRRRNVLNLRRIPTCTRMMSLI